MTHFEDDQNFSKLELAQEIDVCVTDFRSSKNLKYFRERFLVKLDENPKLQFLIPTFVDFGMP